MNWILITWFAFGTPTVEQMMTLEECRARAERHLTSPQGALPRAVCLSRDGQIWRPGK